MDNVTEYGKLDGTSLSIFFSIFQIVMQLPEIRRNVFLYICAFLQELLNHSQDNGLDAKTLGEDCSFLVEMFNPKLDDLFDLYNSNFFQQLYSDLYSYETRRAAEKNVAKEAA